MCAANACAGSKAASSVPVSCMSDRIAARFESGEWCAAHALLWNAGPSLSRCPVTGRTSQLRQCCTQGDAKSDLCDWADENDSDLLLVAASSASGLRKTFGTSTSTYLVHHAPCPTLVVPVQIALSGVEPVTSPTESGQLRGER